MGQTSILSFVKSRALPAAPNSTVDKDAKRDEADLTLLPQRQPESKGNLQKQQSPPSISVVAQLSPPATAYDKDIFIPDHLPQAAIVKIRPSHLPQLKNVTATIFPVKYSDKFFGECCSSADVASLSRAVLFDSKVVGLIRCRLEPFPSPQNPAFQQVYIQAIGVLAPFRQLGLSTALLDFVMDVAARLRPTPTSLYAHVWESNTDALEWYSRRGFTRVNLVPQYYGRLQPAGAWIVRRELS